MTREEQITFEADKYTDNRNNYVEWGNGWEDFDDKEKIEKAFQAGAEWADKNQKDGLVSIDKVCEWIRENWRNHIHKDADDMIVFRGWERELRKAMEDK